MYYKYLKLYQNDKKNMWDNLGVLPFKEGTTKQLLAPRMPHFVRVIITISNNSLARHSSKIDILNVTQLILSLDYEYHKT